MKITISGLLTLLIMIQLSTGCHRGADDILYGETDVTHAESAQPDSTGVSNGWLFDGENPWLSSVNYFGRSVALVNLLIFVIAGSILTMLSLLVFILLNRRRMEKRAKLYPYLLESYQGLIIE